MARHSGQVKGRRYPVPNAPRAEMQCRKPPGNALGASCGAPVTPEDAQREYLSARRAESARESARKRLDAMMEDPSDPRHGTATGRKYGCRCDRCMEARRKGRT